MKTNYDICCESIEKMEQFIDIMKCGWTKEQILSWLKQPSRETEEKQKIRVCYLSDIPSRLKNSRIILERMEARHIIKKYEKGFATGNAEYRFIDCRNTEKCLGLYADQVIIDYRYPMTEIAKIITAMSCVPERWRIIDDRSIDTSDYQKMKENYKSKVYTERPDYADFNPPEKFQAITGIIMTHLRQHPKAICSYSGGADSDIMVDLIETARKIVPSLPPVKYVFFNTGLEMKATKDHVRETAERYGIEIEECRPKIGIVQASRTFGIPFVSKIMSAGLEEWQKKKIPLSIAEEYERAEDKPAKRKELKERYPKCESVINFLCCCNSSGEPRPDIQLVINSSKYMRDFIGENPPDFQISAKCCDYCKKQAAHAVQKNYEMIITGERRDEGGMRSVPRKDNTALCFTETSNGQYRFRPLYYVSDKDKEWYKERFGIRYSDAYEVYGLTRTGCCGCPISHKAVEDLKKIQPYEPNVVKAAWNIFGKSYEYREKYNEYKDIRLRGERERKKNIDGQMSLDDFLEVM